MHFIIFLKQMCERLTLRSQKRTGDKKRLCAKQGDRSTRFEQPGGDGVEFEAMELVRPI